MGRGTEYAAGVRDRFDLTSAEALLLDEVARTIDTLDALAAVIDRDGVTTAGSTGQIVVHPAVSEARMARATLQRLLSGLGLAEDYDGEDRRGETEG